LSGIEAIAKETAGTALIWLGMETTIIDLIIIYINNLFMLGWE
jgi:hypothetical protein